MIFLLFWSRSPGNGQRDDRVSLPCFASPTEEDPEADKSCHAEVPSKLHLFQALQKKHRASYILDLCRADVLYDTKDLDNFFRTFLK